MQGNVIEYVVAAETVVLVAVGYFILVIGLTTFVSYLLWKGSSRGDD